MNPFSSGDGNSLADSHVNGPTPEQATAERKARDKQEKRDKALVPGCMLHDEAKSTPCAVWCGERHCKR